MLKQWGNGHELAFCRDVEHYGVLKQSQRPFDWLTTVLNAFTSASDFEHTITACQ